ncbi:hypothetical protein CCYA_CCYA06G1893 [Cyanidiococcus yangmingshanensis]|nr:hypothetical protein CCYA_CCYA06G1893 [Cyanidiococcus yangmingshanensis]
MFTSFGGWGRTILGTRVRSWLWSVRQRFCTEATGGDARANSNGPSSTRVTSLPDRVEVGSSDGELRSRPRIAKGVVRQVKISHRKLNVVCRLIRRRSVQDAERQLVVCQKKGARILLLLLRQAKANAIHNHQMDVDRIYVRESYVGKGDCFKILRPWHGKGRFAFHEKKYSHATIILEERGEAQANEHEREPSRTRTLWSAKRKAMNGVRPLPTLPAVWKLTVDPASIYQKLSQEQDQVANRH